MLSSYCKCNSTETAMAEVLSDILTALNRGDIPALPLLYPVYTIQPVAKPVEQPVASRKQTFNRLFNWFDTTGLMSVYTIQPVVRPV